MKKMMWIAGAIVATLLIAALKFASEAQAHSVWLERDASGPAKGYFGEFSEDVHEKTGGLLDKIKNPRAFTISEKTPLPLKRQADHLEFAVKEPSDIRMIENSMAPREDKKEGGRSRSVYYAKAGRQDTAAKLDLELVPVEAGGKSFILTFRGAPLPKTEVTLIAPVKWEKSLQTDDKGLVTFPTPWTGRYLARVYHVEQAAGEANGEKFDRTRHVFNLTFVQEVGVPPPSPE